MGSGLAEPLHIVHVYSRVWQAWHRVQAFFSSLFNKVAVLECMASLVSFYTIPLGIMWVADWVEAQPYSLP